MFKMYIRHDVPYVPVHSLNLNQASHAVEWLLRRHYRGCEALAYTDRAARDKFPLLREVDAVDFGRHSARIGQPRKARAGVLEVRATRKTKSKQKLQQLRTKYTKQTSYNFSGVSQTLSEACPVRQV